MRSFLSSFTEPFMLSVLFGIVASIILTLPILAVLYHRRNRLEFGTVMSVYLSILYVFALAFFTLYPLPDNPAQYCATHHLLPQLNPWEFVTDLRTSGLTAVLQIGMNIAFFVPLGFILKRLFRWNGFAIILTGAVVSFLIESAQGTGLFGLFPCAYRLFDVDDLVWNTSGAIVGLVIAALWNRIDPPERFDTSTVTTAPGLIRRLVAFFIDYVLILIVSYVVAIPLAFVFNSGQARNTMATVVTLVVFLLAQGVIPWFSQGQTLAGRFVHMTCETKRRTGSMRAVFYVVRLVVLYVAVIASAGSIWYFVIMLVLFVFWIVKRCMPYDLIPGADWENGAFDSHRTGGGAPGTDVPDSDRPDSGAPGADVPKR
jgi:glycopeptide antibiotics resistance protein